MSLSIIVVTGNNDKFKEISLVLKEFDISCEHKKLKLIEYGENLQDIVVEKAKQAYQQIQKPLIVDDTGIFFSAYKDFPGAFAKRIFMALDYSGLLKLLDGCDRSAYFKTLISFIDDTYIETFSGELKGTITKEIHEGDRPEFPYENIFISKGDSRPYSEATLKEKIETSHRAQAIRKFAEFFANQNKSN